MQTKNPFKPTIKDAYDQYVPNQRYADWQAGYSAGLADSVIASGKVLNAGMKRVGLRLPVISDILEKL
jgi:hypothetical protein